MVFLPGEREIREAAEALRKSTLRRNDEILPLFARLSHAEQHKIFHPVIQALERASLLPAIVFVFSRAGCEQAVTQAVAGGVDLTTADEARRIREVVERRTADIPRADLGVLGFHAWAHALERGVAAHHAGLLPVFKETVEELFSAGLVKVVSH